MAKHDPQDKNQAKKDYAAYRQTMKALHAEQARQEKRGDAKPSATWHKHNKRAAELQKKVPWWKR
ncbi:hypothetical protein [Kribbella sp. NPDC051770]|uniref:hypothetical protein n=1 Tax=Kribbella sp. NPDC051770 TaxID=3155413 RepID=UPI003428DD7C